MWPYLKELNEARALLNQAPWQYSGDLHIEEGGLFFREDDADDYVLAIRVTPCADAGGPSNLFHIETGSIYFSPDRLESALDIIGVKPADATVVDKAIAYCAYHGIDRDAYNGERVVQIGDAEEMEREGWNPEPDDILPEGSKLADYVLDLLD